ncbi:glycoside hydrolase family 15 protein [Streptomyces sp. GESEQ-4]|uniref:glycoside hydrolase family 15 protein n=1 Tax=Streptomyces sp. GESEQ-4 TaxID=2812655 RepID=UPI001FF0BB8F|nr:glycoside hydrolase family 15 protein [Streptomyces sp. GESEQ-4]
MEKPVPPLGPGDALVRTTRALICTSDSHTVQGGIGPREDLTLGHEAVGVVDAIGSEVRDFQPGDRVLVGAITPDWGDLASQNGFPSQSGAPLGGFKFANSKDGVFAEYFHVNDADANLAKIPDDISDAAAVYCADMISTGFMGAEHGNIPMGGTVAVLAQGPVGLMATAGARLRGAGLVIGVESVPSRQKLARMYGADEIVDLHQGERLDLVLSWGRFHRHHRLDTDAMLRATADAWRRWMQHFAYDGPEEPLVRRSAITLKLCDDWANGSLVAAPTSSLPAPIGGIRNWDYRYAWIRDAAYAVFALRRIGFRGEADAFLGWVLDAFEYSGQPRIMYDLRGGLVPDEVEDGELEGYQRSAPVRWGNGAADQRQHDVYGEILDCADQWLRSGGEIQTELWANLATLADAAERTWRQPDQGIWEVRSEGRVFTYSAGLCQVALDRAAQMGERLGLPGRIAQWRTAADQLRRLILEQSWDEDAQTLSAHLDGGGLLDASLLALPLRHVVPADHPRMVATTHAIADRLSAGDGLLYRYLHKESPDGLAGDEGAFVLCSFWLVDNLIGQGRIQDAEELYASLCARASPLGLLSEQINPVTGEFMGNFPQAFSHIGIIASGVNLARAKAGAQG